MQCYHAVYIILSVFIPRVLSKGWSNIVVYCVQSEYVLVIFIGIWVV